MPERVYTRFGLGTVDSDLHGQFDELRKLYSSHGHDGATSVLSHGQQSAERPAWTGTHGYKWNRAIWSLIPGSLNPKPEDWHTLDGVPTGFTQIPSWIEKVDADCNPDELADMAAFFGRVEAVHLSASTNRLYEDCPTCRFHAGGLAPAPMAWWPQDLPIQDRNEEYCDMYVFTRPTENGSEWHCPMCGNWHETDSVWFMERPWTSLADATWQAHEHLCSLEFVVFEPYAYHGTTAYERLAHLNAGYGEIRNPYDSIYSDLSCSPAYPGVKRTHHPALLAFYEWKHALQDALTEYRENALARNLEATLSK